MTEKQYKQMSEEEIKELRESLALASQEMRERGKKILTVESALIEKAETLFETCLEKLHGEYQLYTVYNNTNEDTMAVYGLVYAEFYEEDGYDVEGFLKVLKEDGKFLHEKLKESNLPIDYYYIMPYYNPSTGEMAGQSILYNDSIVLTNEIE